METTRIANDIYDLLSEALLPQKQENDWAKLKKRFAKEAKQRLRKIHGKKYITIDNKTNIITIGERNPIKIKITQTI